MLAMVEEERRKSEAQEELMKALRARTQATQQSVQRALETGREARAGDVGAQWDEMKDNFQQAIDGMADKIGEALANPMPEPDYSPD